MCNIFKDFTVARKRCRAYKKFTGGRRCDADLPSANFNNSGVNDGPKLVARHWNNVQRQRNFLHICDTNAAVCEFWHFKMAVWGHVVSEFETFSASVTAANDCCVLPYLPVKFADCRILWNYCANRPTGKRFSSQSNRLSLFLLVFFTISVRLMSVQCCICFIVRLSSVRRTHRIRCIFMSIKSTTELLSTDLFTDHRGEFFSVCIFRL